MSRQYRSAILAKVRGLFEPKPIPDYYIVGFYDDTLSEKRTIFYYDTIIIGEVFKQDDSSLVLVNSRLGESFGTTFRDMEELTKRLEAIIGRFDYPSHTGSYTIEGIHVIKHKDDMYKYRETSIRIPKNFQFDRSNITWDRPITYEFI